MNDHCAVCGCELTDKEMAALADVCEGCENDGSDWSEALDDRQSEYNNWDEDED